MQHAQLIAEARKHVGQFALATDWLTAGSVASALVTAAGNLYTGICLDLACGVGFCAEHAAVAAMLLQRETVVVTIVAVTADAILPPCGRCRELLLQVDRRNLDCTVILPTTTMPLRDLLPVDWLSDAKA